jgi:hypothetical protein
MSNLRRNKTYLVSKAELVEPNSDVFRAVAASIQEKYGMDLKPQMDLLYMRSCLVSAGLKAGINDNDDIFTREEAWAARHSPVFKPFNWQHQDKDIVGVIYSVEARDLNGNVLDFSDNRVPDQDFDLWTEAVIFRLIHPDRANEVEARAAKNDLYVSMEAWFDDYGYGICDENGKLDKIVARNEKTSFLDKHLRASGGAGLFEEKRIGRVLRSITFGGCGLVDRPANKRSVISDVTAGTFDTDPVEVVDIEFLLQKVMESDSTMEETLMNTQANQKDTKAEIAETVGEVLDQREKVQADRQAKAALEARAAEAEQKNKELEQQVSDLSEANETKEAEVQALNETLNRFNEVVDNLVESEQAAAGATGDTPAEIAAIDGAKDGEGAFRAKMSWIEKSLASLRSRAANADKLEAELVEAAKIVRENEVRAMFANVLPEETVDALVARASALSDEDYELWRDEKELMALDMTQAADPELKEKMNKKGKEGAKEEKEAQASDLFRALLERRRSEGMEADPGTPGAEPHLINPPGGDGLKSGVNPGGLRTPRHKIAGSAAGNDLEAVLENAQAEDDVNLAGATQAGGEENGVSPFRSLAAEITGYGKEDEDPASEKPGFDPVQ